MHRVFAGVGIGVVTAAIFAGAGLRGVSAQDDASKPAFYKDKVRPILVTNCAKCHMNMDHKGGLSLQTKASTLKGGRDGVVIVPGDPANSLLVKLIRHEGPPDDPKPMPPKSPKMSDADIAVVEQWVKAGAVMPDDPPAQ
jgi:mono/diheme cytochrome c family protein